MKNPYELIILSQPETSLAFLAGLAPEYSVKHFSDAQECQKNLSESALLLLEDRCWDLSLSSLACSIVMIRTAQPAPLPDHPLSGVIDHNWEAALVKPILNTLVEYQEYKNQFSELLPMLQSQLERVQNLHQKLAPLKQLNHRGVHLQGKYAVGGSAGGEFFEMEQKEHRILLFAFHSRSYLLNSLILAAFSKLIQLTLPSAEQIQNFLLGCQHDAERILEDKDHFAFFWLDLNTKSLEASIHSQGGFFFFPHQEAPTSSLKVSKLLPGQKFTLLSPGFWKNWTLNKHDEYDFQELWQKNPSIDEAFFQLYKENKSGFLVDDALLVSLKVDSNAVFQV